MVFIDLTDLAEPLLVAVGCWFAEVQVVPLVVKSIEFPPKSRLVSGKSTPNK